MTKSFVNASATLVFCNCAVWAGAPPMTVTGGLTNVIPTPQFIEAKQGQVVLAEGDRPCAVIVLDKDATTKERTAAEYLRDRVKLISGAELPTVRAASVEGGAVHVVIGSLEPKTIPGGFLSTLTRQDREFLARDDGTDQDYVVDCVTAGGKSTVILCGATPQGALYAAMTFMHTLSKADGQVTAPSVHVRDYPDVRYRWFFPRVFVESEDRIHFAMEHKVNLINAFEYYHFTFRDAERQLRLNRHARSHGVGLLHLVMGDVGLKNRRSYPDAPTYKCLYQHGPSQLAYCVSNDALIAEKQRILREFTDAVEPGCLYIHFVDEDDYRDATAVWSNRCPDCRTKWPNDVIEAPDGKAGAQAVVFDRLAEAIFSVKHQDSGYDAARDCLIIFVSAPYTVWAESDDVWDKEVTYHVTVSQHMTQVENVHFCIRENSLQADGTKRCAEMVEALRTQGNGHGVMMYYLGGDRRHHVSGYPVRHSLHRTFTCAPILMKSFEGCSSLLITGSSHTLIKAEYGWNMESTGYYLDPKTRGEWGAAFRSIIVDGMRPPEIYGEGRFVDRAMVHMYGRSSAQRMRSLYVPEAHGEGLPEILPPIGSASFSYSQSARAVHDSTDTNRKWAKLFAAYRAAAAKCIPNVEESLRAPDFHPAYRGNTERLLAEMRYGEALSRVGESEALLFAAMVEGEPGEQTVHEAAIAAALAEAKRLAEEHPAEGRREQLAKTVSDFDGALKAKRASYKKVQEQVRRLNQQRKLIEDDLSAERARVSASIALKSPTAMEDDVARLRELKIGLMGSTGPVVTLLKERGVSNVEVLRRGVLPTDLADYGVLCLLHSVPRLSWEDIMRLHAFVENGGGVLFTSAAPFFVVGNTVDLNSIVLLLGAMRYGNSSGPMQILEQSCLTQDLPEKQYFRAERSAACVGTPLAGVPVACYALSRNLISVLANTYGEGRSAYLWQALGDPEDPTEQEKLLLRTLRWLGGVDETR